MSTEGEHSAATRNTSEDARGRTACRTRRKYPGLRENDLVGLVHIVNDPLRDDGRDAAGAGELLELMRHVLERIAARRTVLPTRHLIEQLASLVPNDRIERVREVHLPDAMSSGASLVEPRSSHHGPDSWLCTDQERGGLTMLGHCGSCAICSLAAFFRAKLVNVMSRLT